MTCTVTQLAKRASVSTQRIRQLIAEGAIGAEKFGSIWAILDDEAERWLRSRSDGTKKSLKSQVIPCDTARNVLE